MALAAALIVSFIGRSVAMGDIAEGALAFLLTCSAAAATLAYRFYRDPERTIPTLEGSIVSPADGTVLYVRESNAGNLPIARKNGTAYSLAELTGVAFHDEEAVVIGIAMNFLDVHVNRSPRLRQGDP